MLLKMTLVVAILAGALAGCQRQESTLDAKAVVTKPAKDRAPATAKVSEDEFRTGMALEGVREVQYLGDDGGKLTFAEFIATVQAGRSFKKEVEMDKSLAVMTINPLGKKVPESAESNEGSQVLNFPVSAKLPSIQNRDLDGHLHTLANGKSYTLLSFFFAECVPCIQEIPALNALSGGQGSLSVVSITFEDKETASTFAVKRGLRVPIIADSKNYIDALGVKTYPTLVLVSPEGRLMGVRSSYKVTGSQDSGLAELKSWLNSLGLKT
jgi:thiol-disulfide isomerase/thioredoxin